MLGLPEKTELNKKIPKQALYENMNVPNQIKKSIVEQIKAIYWRNKISSDTINLAEGEAVTEIQIFEIKLNGDRLDETVLSFIDKQIPYHIIFALEHEGEYQVWIAYKQAITYGNNAFKVGTYYHTKWLDESSIPLKIEGLNIDKVYENFVRQIAGNSLQTSDVEESLQEAVERDTRKKKIEKKIDELEAKARKEKQSKKKYEIFMQIKEYKTMLEEI